MSPSEELEESLSDHILLFTKHPVAGFAKTRLIPSQGPQGAADISRILTEHTLTTIREYNRTVRKVQTVIYHANPAGVSPVSTSAWLKPSSSEVLVPQCSGTLGDRLISAFGQSFSKGASKVIVVGIDTPDITPELYRDAFQALDQHDIVIGPSLDGGYYLLGMNKLHHHLFHDIPWSTSTVFQDTVSKASAAHLSAYKLPPLRDIDELDDLQHFSIAEIEKGNSLYSFGLA